MIPRIKTGTGRQFQQIYFVQTYVAGDSRILGCGPHIRYVLQHGWLEMGQLGPSACVLFAIRIFFLTLPSRHSRWPLRYILSVLIGLLAWTEDGAGGGGSSKPDKTHLIRAAILMACQFEPPSPHSPSPSTSSSPSTSRYGWNAGDGVLLCGIGPPANPTTGDNTWASWVQ